MGEKANTDKGELKGEHVFLTGASSGIGRAAAIRLAQAGAYVAGIARTEEDLEDTRRLVHKQTGEERMIPIPCDVTQEDQVKDAFQQAVDALG
ncbi:MAG: SDR family NAD(P)-dependent oxidoreductase, partial [Anaerolineales bacterium]|nr:SDR family NAD(P)-dependent oxidoreductase [Anaerolineales bacterium]